MFEWAKKCNIKFNVNKLQYYQWSYIFGWFLINGMPPDQEKISSIKGMANPTNKTKFLLCV